MNPRISLLGGLALFAATTGGFAEAPATNTPPGPVTMVNLTNAEVATPAPPQPNAKSAPGAAAPSGSNGTTPSGKPVTKAPNTPPKKVSNPNATPPPAATATATAAAKAKAPASIFDSYMSDLGDTLKLSDEEKKEIQNYYVADGPTVKNILNNNALSPLQQAQEVAELRQKRDDKIEGLLDDPMRRHEFHEVEARYRVALTEFAADGGLAPAQPAPALPQTPAATPAQATPNPATKTGAE